MNRTTSVVVAVQPPSQLPQTALVAAAAGGRQGRRSTSSAIAVAAGRFRSLIAGPSRLPSQVSHHRGPAPSRKTSATADAIRWAPPAAGWREESIDAWGRRRRSGAEKKLKKKRMESWKSFLFWVMQMIWLSLTLACSDVYPPPPISKTLLSTANGAMCLDGSPAAYFFDQGEGKGVDNWLIFIEISYNLSPYHVTCLLSKNCTLAEMTSIEGLRSGLIKALPISDPFFRGMWVTSCVTHEITVYSWISRLFLHIDGNKTYPQVFANWFYDRSAVQIIDQSIERKNCSDYGLKIKKTWW